MANQGTDLSALNPAENKMWQNRIYPAVESVAGIYPEAARGVQFLSEEAALPFTHMSRVQSPENPGLFYRFGNLSRYSHTTLMRMTFLLRKLGNYVPSPKILYPTSCHFREWGREGNLLTKCSRIFGLRLPKPLVW